MPGGSAETAEAKNARGLLLPLNHALIRVIRGIRGALLPCSNHCLSVHAIVNNQGSCAFHRVRFRWFILFAPCLFTRRHQSSRAGDPSGALALLGFLGAGKSYDWAAVVLLIAAALFIVSRRTPIYQRITSATPWVSFDAGGKIFVPAATNRLFTCLRKFAAENIAPRERVLIAPYPILGHESPVMGSRLLLFRHGGAAGDDDSLVDCQKCELGHHFRYTSG